LNYRFASSLLKPKIERLNFNTSQSSKTLWTIEIKQKKENNMKINICFTENLQTNREVKTSRNLKQELNEI
jgi:hypothetical protein